MQTDINQTEAEIVEEFAFFPGWMEKYEHLIDLGKNLPRIADEHKTDQNLIRGCQSQVWLHAELVDGRVRFTADSDAIITKGIVALMIRVYDNRTPEEILASDAAFVDEIGLKEHLSPTRSNGLAAMIKQMKYYALAFKANN
ncbi:MAG TPA: SufE family protein [Cryomorphaceae bacterium]|nr:SufE family protein [Cryomorphaceae bacterium]